ncbi:MAG: hypothetical protein JWO08_3503, partial [Verrucomicrobiaceae bacterium]|nr:hypothetical protein [Verrucomicrobiaceae bacterium]
MLLYRTPLGPVVEQEGVFTLITDNWTELLNRDDLPAYLPTAVASGQHTEKPTLLLSPVS